jgi:NAD(P)-dependent dehydrogenase (short-subunit alcohol dehydrogenase family)
LRHFGGNSRTLRGCVAPAAGNWAGRVGRIGLDGPVRHLRTTGLWGRSGARAAGIKVNALSPGFVATDLNNHSGTDTAEQGGARIARQVLLPDDGPTGVFLRESGGTYPW